MIVNPSESPLARYVPSPAKLETTLTLPDACVMVMEPEAVPLEAVIGSGFVLWVPSAKSIVLPVIGMPVSVSVSTRGHDRRVGVVTGWALRCRRASLAA